MIVLEDGLCEIIERQRPLFFCEYRKYDPPMLVLTRSSTESKVVEDSLIIFSADARRQSHWLFHTQTAFT